VRGKGLFQGRTPSGFELGPSQRRQCRDLLFERCGHLRGSSPVSAFPLSLPRKSSLMAELRWHLIGYLRLTAQKTVGTGKLQQIDF
jgi:hypothetical protein